MPRKPNFRKVFSHKDEAMPISPSCWCQLSILTYGLSTLGLPYEPTQELQVLHRDVLPGGGHYPFYFDKYSFPYKLGCAQELCREAEQNFKTCPIRFKGFGLCFIAYHRATNLVLFRGFNSHLISYLSKI